MRAVALTGPGKLEVIDAPTPGLARASDVLLKMAKVGICGSDLHYFKEGRIGTQVVKYPFVMGHECSGTVVETAPAVRRVRLGDQVAVDPAISCHECDQCRQGRPHTCRRLAFMGCPGEAPGCLAEYIVLPEDCLYPITGRLSLEQAVLCEPVTIALHAIRQAGRLEGSLVGVLGCGPIGLCVLLAAKQAGAATVWATDRVVARVTAALRLGATWAGNPDHSDPVAEIRRQEPLGLDVVFECAGQQDTLDQATELLKPGGKLVIVGIPPMSRVSFCLDALRRKELSVLNVRRQNQRMQWAIELVASGELAVGFLVTHRFAVQQAQSAFELAAEYRDGVLKALVEF